MLIKGNPGDDFLAGTTGNDIFDLTDGGNDKAVGDLGNDIFKLGDTLTAADRINGALGSDILALFGDYSAGLVFNDFTVRNVETIHFRFGGNYNLTTADRTVAAGTHLLVDGSDLSDTEHLFFDGSAETDGAFTMVGGKGDDNLRGGDGDDTFNIGRGGIDVVRGGLGDDTIIAGNALTRGDRIDGGGGDDTLVLRSGSSRAVLLNSNIQNVENIDLTAGHSYSIVTGKFAYPLDGTLTVDGSSLGAADTFFFGGAFETQHLALIGGAGADTFAGGIAEDTFTGGGGADIFDYKNGILSTTTVLDKVTDFIAGSDKFQFAFHPNTVQTTSVDQNLGLSLDDYFGNFVQGVAFGTRYAVIMDFVNHDFAGRSFLYYDSNGDGHYNGGVDFAVEITGHTGTLSLGDFIGQGA